MAAGPALCEDGKAMAFSHSDHDMLVPKLARIALYGSTSGDVVDPVKLAVSVGVQPETARSLVEALARAGFVARGPDGRWRRTARPVRLLAIDLGGTKLHVALVDETGQTLGERIEATNKCGGRAVIDQIGMLCDDIAVQAGLRRSEIAAAALGSPGTVQPLTGRIVMAPNIADFDTFDVAGAIRARLALPVRIENDVNMAALGEQAEGAAKAIENFALVALGTGIGLGLVLNGALVRGATGLAGEIALMPIGADPFAASSHRLGPLETAIGSEGLVRSARQSGLEAVDDVETLFKLARSGNGKAASVIADAARTLFLALGAVKAIVDPELIVLSGSIGMQPEVLEHLCQIASGHPFAPRLAVSTLDGRAAIAGAASCALAEALRTEPMRTRGAA